MATRESRPWLNEKRKKKKREKKYKKARGKAEREEVRREVRVSLLNKTPRFMVQT